MSRSQSSFRFVLPLCALSAAAVLLADGGCAPTRENNGAGGSSQTAGTTGSGGDSIGVGGSAGDSVGTGGAAGSGASGGSSVSGAAGDSGGTGDTGGATGTAGTTGSAGTTGTGGVTGAAGSTGRGGTTGTGGSAGRGGTTGTAGTGGAAGRGGTTGAAGTAAGGTTGTGGTGSGAMGPCDIYQAANTPCVAAHSSVRALYGTYNGPLYQVRRASDKTTKDVPVLAPGGFVNVSVQDTFCSGTTCTISILYDQSPNHNDLVKSGVALWLKNGGNEANAADGRITVSGHVAHGIYVDNDGSTAKDVGYRNNATKGLATGDQPEAMYMVLDPKRYSTICCFDYGNAETTNSDAGSATMEAIYWGASTQWTRGGGNGPWVAADLENGMFEGDSTNTPTNTSVTGFSYATAMLKGPSGNAFGLKAGDATSGALQTKWNGKRPPGYSPMKKQGSIILGTGGDGSDFGKGTFFEGAITSGSPPDATDDAVQANIVAAGYGR